MSTRGGMKTATHTSAPPRSRTTKHDRRELARAAREGRRRRDARKRRTRRVGLTVLGVLVLAGLGFAVRSLGSPTTAPVSATSVARVASTRFSASDGKPFTLAGLRGSKVVLYFYEGQSCGACQTQLQQLQAQLPDLETH